jgi:hypothetical protein
VLVALSAVVYAGDFVWFEYRMRNATPQDPLETMTFYYATDVKGGKVEIFYDQPQTQTCVHALFPHQGYTPCWRFNRSGIKRISLAIPRLGDWMDCHHFAGWAAGAKGSALGADAGTAIERAPFFPTARTAKKWLSVDTPFSTCSPSP